MISLDEALVLRDKAARETMDRIANDRAKVRGAVGKSLDHLRDHLFDPNLSVETMKRACDIRSNSFPNLFRRAVGIVPSTYLRDRRFDIGGRLLVESEMLVAMVGEMIGYLRPESFSDSFKTWSGERPSDYRISRRAAKKRQAEALALDEANGDKLWDILATWTFQQQIEFFRAQSEFPSPQVFAFLRHKSQEVVRHDQQRGCQIAWLLVESTSTLDHITLEDAARLFADPPPITCREVVALKVRAWAWLGNVHTLMLDYPAAENAFRHAEYHRPLLSKPCPADGELCRLKALLRWYQQRLPEATHLACEAVQSFRHFSDKESLAKALLVRGAIARSRDDLERALECFQEVEETMEEEGDRELYFAGSFEVANTFECMGRFQEAADLLPRVGSLLDDEKLRPRRPFFRWLQGRLASRLGDAETAATALEEARQEFLAGGQSQYTAAVCLDLALVAAKRGEAEEAARLAAEVLPLFHAHSRPEALSAVSLLQNALDHQAVDLSLLERLKSALERLRRDPTLRL